MARPTLAVVIVVATAVLLWQCPAWAEEARSDPDPVADRSWRIAVSAPVVRLDAFPLGWGLAGEMGVQFLHRHMIMISMTRRAMNGGGIGYLYEHPFVRRILAIQAGAFIGFWDVPSDADEWGEETEIRMAAFCPTVRLIAGYSYAFVQAAFNAHVGTSVYPSFYLGLHFKV